MNPQPHASNLKTKERIPKILLAEDDTEMRSLLAYKLMGAGYLVIRNPDGMSLLDYLGGHLLEENLNNIALIISDIRMPGISGLEILEGLQNFPDVPPIVLITAFGSDQVHNQAAGLGAAAVVDKPFDLDDFLALIDKLIRRPVGRPEGGDRC